MKRILLIGLFAALLGPTTETAFAGQCYTPAPICMYPSIPMCICSGFSCYWICAHR